MNGIKATWTNEQIVPAEPVNWPESSHLLMEPVSAAENFGLTEEEWRDDPESIGSTSMPGLPGVRAGVVVSHKAFQ
jgi:hypothetical protein